MPEDSDWKALKKEVLEGNNGLHRKYRHVTLLNYQYDNFNGKLRIHMILRGYGTLNVADELTADNEIKEISTRKTRK
ncbi:hypothetical protein Tco_1154717 [Tanacetum coccineum]